MGTEEQQPNSDNPPSAPDPQSLDEKDSIKNAIKPEEETKCKFIPTHNTKETCMTNTNDLWNKYNVIALVSAIISLCLAILTLNLFWQNAEQFQIANRPNIDMGWVRYVWINENGPTSLTPGKQRNIRFYINDFGIHPVHIYNYKVHFIFDTAAAKIEELVKEMKSDKYLKPWNVAVPVFAPNALADFSQDCIFDLNPTREDCIKMEEGICTFYLEIEFTNEFSKCWRTYIAIMTLRDHHGPTTLIDLLKYSENRDSSGINRPLPWE